MVDSLGMPLIGGPLELCAWSIGPRDGSAPAAGCASSGHGITMAGGGAARPGDWESSGLCGLQRTKKPARVYRGINRKNSSEGGSELRLPLSATGARRPSALI
ncbi:hypothetical protein Pta02_47750 [Planobispora takensis]|uniref:Uncharacterized protein n=1 Tax=Planobispora takensis TaxID=1367882 RepID=A0A8J3WXE3_9ACTN|nr:hypothetical protein Pta02_47750 [Planobispora takensis]